MNDSKQIETQGTGLLKSPVAATVDLLIIAGEHSGDEHAGRVVLELKAENPGLNIAALGGEKLKEAGAQLVFNMLEHSVVGFAEVLINIRFFFRLRDELVSWIVKYKPKNICFVDYPGFNLRLAEQLTKMGLSRKGGGTIGVYFYISPQIWAWKAHRRFKMAKWLDGLGVIFPFEVACFSDTELPVEFVGHPFVAEDFENPMRYDKEGPVVLLPGSRKGAVSRIFPAMLHALETYRKNHPEEHALVVYPSDYVRDVLETCLVQQEHLIPFVQLKPIGNDIISAKAVLTSSGTMSLACALAGIPGAIAYRAHPLTYYFAKTLIKVDYLGIANLILKEAILPEYIQGEAGPDALANEIELAIHDSDRIARAAEGSKRLVKALTGEGEDNSPAKWLLRGMSE